jgi:Putative SAM-dependent methyltransferase
MMRIIYRYAAAAAAAAAAVPSLLFAVVPTTALQKTVAHRRHPHSAIPIRQHNYHALFSVVNTVTDHHRFSNSFENFEKYNDVHSNHDDHLSNCCVLDSIQFPTVALDVAQRLSVPLIPVATTTDKNTGSAIPVPTLALTLKQQHIIVIEPYTYESQDMSYWYTIHNYSIGIVSLTLQSKKECRTKESNSTKQQQEQEKAIHSSSKKSLKQKPYYIDFMPPLQSRLGRRNNGNSGQPDLLLKAFRSSRWSNTKNSSHHLVTSHNDNNNNYSNRSNATSATKVSSPRPRPPSPLLIYDATAGLGQDSLLIAHAMIQQHQSNIKNSNSKHRDLYTDGTGDRKDTDLEDIGGTIGRVHMIERHPLIAMLLQDALRRLQLIATAKNDSSYTATNTNVAQLLHQCLSLEWNDGVHVFQKILDNLENNKYRNNTLPDHQQSTATTAQNETNVDATTDTTTISSPQQTQHVQVPDIIYLDPMFPTRKKSASVKKNMQLLHSLLGETAVDTSTSNNDMPEQTVTFENKKDQDELTLVRTAYDVARYRVIVKRPIHAPSFLWTATTLPAVALTNVTTTIMIKPSYQIDGTINRWDIYNKP